MPRAGHRQCLPPVGIAFYPDSIAFARELLHGFDEMLAADQHAFDMTYLKDRSRDMIMLLLEMVEKTEDPKYIPLLAAWAQVDYKKVRKRIRQVVDRLRQANGDA